MKSTGLVRRIDKLGRVVLPSELRRTMNLGDCETVEIFVEGSSIILKKYNPACIFCDSGRNVSLFKGKNICARCLRQLQEAPAANETEPPF